ncbi:DUF3466 family protein [Cellulomonas phragmiteti]|uniref:Uncharacterized protein n=1 Tax=Cellulomonas phragmiteti TaxID=478780 RepID=A0ABQ4DHA3_9CELL|nr:DUF3466 family protein [Cellulomonas phragmiteti]GIG38732.1 hypothetical protein Cph01nite_04940 [Cellulomonas phragmiteti]
MARIGAVLLAAAMAVGTAPPAVAWAGAPPTGCGAYEVTDLRAADGWSESTSGFGVNNAGVVVGVTRPAYGVPTAFLWSSDVGLSTIEVPGASYSAATDINDRGQVVGEATYPDGTTRPFVFDSRTGRTTDLGTLGGPEAYATAINNRGQVVGASRTAAWEFQVHAFLWSPSTGVMRDLGTLGGDDSQAFGINDHGQVVGRAMRAEGYHVPFVWEPRSGRMVQPSGEFAGGSAARGINNRGDMVGWAENGWQASSNQAFFRSARTRTVQALTGVEEGGTRAVGITEDGTVVGMRFNDADGWFRTTVWHPATGCVAELASPEVALVQVFGISGNGHIVAGRMLWSPAAPRS